MRERVVVEFYVNKYYYGKEKDCGFFMFGFSLKSKF